MPWAGPVTPTAPAPLTSRRSGVPVSATLAANEALARRRRGGQQVLPLAFGEAGLPVHPRLREALAAAAASGSYGPVAGIPALREAAAGYWARRGLPTEPGRVVAGPGSKPLLYAVLLAIGTDVAVPRPSWVSYAAQTQLTGARPHFVPAAPGEGGVCDAEALDRVVTEAAGGRPRHPRRHRDPARQPDRPTGQPRRDPRAVRGGRAARPDHHLATRSTGTWSTTRAAFLSPASVAPERTVVTTALSKSLALGGWRIGVARLPDGPLGPGLTERLLGIASEIWSAPAGPVQHAAAVGFSEPAEIAERIDRSRSLHAAVARAVAGLFRSAGLLVPAPQAAFYLYPDFAPWREPLRRRGVHTGADLARHLVDRYGAGALPASAFGEPEDALRLRLATGLLYGDTDEQREAALAATDPVALPWVASALTAIEDMLADLSP